MHNLSLSSLFDIQLFGEGAGGGDGGTGAGTAGTTPAGQTEAAPVQPQSGRKSNPLANVQYGIQENAAPAAGEQLSADDRNAKFEALIKGEYKDLYDARVQETIQKRLKSTSETVAKYNALAPMLDILTGKYGTEKGNIEALVKAIEEDESFYEDEALERGLTVAQVKEIRKMERENAALKAQMEQEKTQKQADALYAAWMQQAEAVKQIYPGFDLQGELQNEQFRALLKSNVPIQTAYEVIHKDEILPAAMNITAAKIQEKTANDIRSGQRRPTEGAMGGRAAVVVKSDVSQLTKQDRREINRRVARGEKVRF
ncbi:MAG: hypothetical protein IJV40_03565 [Oscillospiraceae bacterium]|nr:hypothetical protein [Oscillospiraceae bacterium]